MKPIFLLLLFISSISYSQNTVSLPENGTSPTADLQGWEEKDEVRSFKVVKVEKNRVYFEGFTFEKVGGNEVNIYALIENEEGTADEVTFNFTRYQKQQQ
jgi:hypothetical protein